MSQIPKSPERTRREQVTGLPQDQQELIFNAISEGIHWIGMDGRIVFENRAAANMLGWERSELIGRPAHSTMHHTRADGRPFPQSECPIYAGLATGATRRVNDEVFWRKDGTAFPVEYTSSPVRDDKGDIIGAVVVFTDITDRKQTESALRESTEKFQILANHITDAFWIRSPDMRDLYYVSPAFERIWGRSADSLYANPQQWSDFTLPEDREAVLAAFARLRGDAPSVDLEYRIVRPNGDIRWIRVRGFQVRDAAGTLTSLTGIVTDITEQHHYEQKLERQQSELRVLFDLVPAMILFKDTNNRILRVNQRVAETARISIEEIEGKPAADVFPREAAAYYADDLEVIRSKRPRLGTVHTVRDLDGTEHWLQTDKVPVCNGDGTVTGIIVMAQDITERRRAEEALRESEERFSGAFEHAPIGVALVSPEGRWLKVNRALCELVGYTEAELLTRTFQDITYPEDLELDLEYVRRMVAGEIRSYQMEKRYIHARGHLVAVLLNVSLVRDGQGRPRYFISQIQDITERKLAEQALRTSTEEFRLVTEAMPQIVWITTPAGENLYFNQHWMDYTGLTLEESTGHGWNAPFHPEDQQRAWDAWREATATLGTYSIECRLRRADGVYRWWLIRGVPLKDANGLVLKWFGTCTDVHDLKLAELEISRANRALQAEVVERTRAEDAAEAANRAKSEFLANMSHEIRTPLNGILGMTDLALGTELSIEQREYLNMAKSSGESLASVINDILDFSKIEAGKLVVDLIPFDLSDCLVTTLKRLAPPAHAKGLELAFDLGADVPHALIGDPGRLRQIVTNLVGNAIKFTARGEVVLRVTTAAPTDRGLIVQFSVSDSGIGVSPEQRDAIFMPFTQADGSTTRRYGGTGLGLTISRSLVGLLGGRMWLESEIGKGSTFRFTVPFDRQPASAIETRATAPQAGPLRDMPVLVVDDNAVNRRILEVMLGRWLMRPVLAESGPAGLSAIRQRALAGAGFPLVLLDVHMPDMDGFSVADQIRNDPALAVGTIVMLTSTGHGGDTARCRALGIAAYLTKPIGQDELLQAILVALNMPAQAPDRTLLTSRHVRESRPALRILLAEDNKVNQMVAARLLEKCGNTVVIAADGREALAALDDPRNGTFDLILMDVQMPGMDGFEATGIIRAREKTSGTHIPIIAMTAHAMKGDEERCRAAGMDGYVSKPFQIEQLLAAIDGLLA